MPYIILGRQADDLPAEIQECLGALEQGAGQKAVYAGAGGHQLQLAQIALVIVAKAPQAL